VRSLIAASAATIVGLGLAVTPAAPAHATVHEIVGQWCSGQDPLEPPGLTGGSSADNFAKPLMAIGFIGDVVPFDGPEGPGLLVTFNYDVRPAKVRGTGVFVVIDMTPAGPLYLELIEPDPSFPAFRSCPRLATG
jgi:hypothetical protein